MPRTRYVARNRRTTSPRRKFIWARTSVTGSMGANSIGRSNLLSNFESLYGAELIGCTIVRIRGIITTSSSAIDQLFVAAAMVEPDPVGTLDVAEGPTQRPYASWMLYEPFVTSGLANGAQNETGARMIDVKANRKLDELDEQLSFYIQTPSGNSTTVGYHYSLSVGVKLP